MATPEPMIRPVIDRTVFPRLEFCHFTSECYNYSGEKVVLLHKAAENQYFIESGENSPMIDDYKKKDTSTSEVEDEDESPEDSSVTLQESLDD